MRCSYYTPVLTALTHPQLHLPVLSIKEDTYCFDRWIHHPPHSLQQLFVPGKASGHRTPWFKDLLQTLPHIPSLRRLEFRLIRWSPPEAHQLFLLLSSAPWSLECLAFIGGSAAPDTRVVILDGLKRSATLKRLLCVRSNLWDACLLAPATIVLQLEELEVYWPKCKWNLNAPYQHPSARLFKDSDEERRVRGKEIFVVLSSNKVLKSFCLSSLEKLDWDFEELLQVMLEVNRTLTTLRLQDVGLKSSAVLCLMSGLAKNNTLQVLDISSNSLKPEAVTNLAIVLTPTTSTNNQIQAANTSIRSLILGGSDSEIGKVGAHALAGMVGRNTTLTRLEIRDENTMSSGDIIGLFRALEINSSLRSFSLKGCSGVSACKVYPTIMDTLKLNRTIESLELSDTPLGRQPEKIKAIAEQLHRNRQEIQVFRKLPRVKPKSVRLFLCGHPFAGKSTLWENMAKSLSTRGGRFSLLRNISKKNIPVTKTHGIAITSIAHQDIRISVWDLAGELEYQVLHDLMFPINDAPSLFLIVCNPFSKSTACDRSQRRDTWQDEILYWLQYICSHTPKSDQRYLPRVTLVFTHRDCVSRDEDELRRWERAARSYQEGVRVKFQGFLEIFSGPELHVLDARSMDMANHVVEHVVKVSREVIDDLPEYVYKVCNDARDVLIAWREKHRQQAILSWRDFSRLCRTQLPDLAAAGPQELELTEAVATSLNDSGDVIYLPNTKVLIVRPDWFCHKFMGSMIHLEVDRLCSLPYSDGKKTHSLEVGNDAFITRDDLERVLNKSLMKDGKFEVAGLSEKDLVDILVELKLCYEMHSSSISNEPLLLIPANLSASHRRLEWKLEHKTRSRPIYVGRRLQCDDPQRTFLTPGFFPAIQVILHGQFVKESKENRMLATLQKHLVHILLNSMEIYVQWGGDQGHYIDILVKSFEDIGKTLKLLRLMVISHIHGRRPWPGVSLVEGIIQPYYVEHLESCESRKERCVLINDLDQEYIDESRLRMSNFCHMWPPNESGKAICDPIAELLAPEEITDILSRRQASLEKLAVRLQLHGQPSSEPDHSQTQRALIGPSSSEAIACSSEEIARSSSDRRSSQGKVTMNLVHHTVMSIKDDLFELRNVVDNIDRTVNDVREFQRYEEHLLQDARRNLEDLFKYSAQWHEHRVPSNFFIDVPGGYVPGFTKLRLHFLCDSKDGAHVIERQPGITIHKANIKGVEKIIPYILKVLGFLSLGLKLGVHFVSGMGQIMPNLSQTLAERVLGLGALAMDTPGLIDQLLERSETQLHAGSGAADCAQEWLLDFLTRNNCVGAKEIEDTFHLYRIKYPEGGSAWVCKDHRSDGHRY